MSIIIEDPLSFALAGIMTVAVAVTAGYFAAPRAARIDPMAALQSE